MPNHFFAPRTIRVFLQSLIIAAPLACSILLVDAGEVAASVLSSPSWTTYREQASGISLEFPRDVFVVDSGEAAVGLGRTYLSRDGRAILMIFSVARTPGNLASRIPKEKYRDYWLEILLQTGHATFFCGIGCQSRQNLLRPLQFQ